MNCDFNLEIKSDANEIHADDSNIDGESDNETNTSMMTESKASISQGLIIFYFVFFKLNFCIFKDHLDYFCLLQQPNKNEKMKKV